VSEGVLYSFRRCPYAMRARMALRYSGAAVQIIEVSLKAKPAEMLALGGR
jgi:glutathione S-transferase